MIWMEEEKNQTGKDKSLAVAGSITVTRSMSQHSRDSGQTPLAAHLPADLPLPAQLGAGEVTSSQERGVKP